MEESLVVVLNASLSLKCVLFNLFLFFVYMVEKHLIYALF